ncbi:hypothetical protein HETIRDRAFT_457549 [Heterobasidion irregulare TC 32-1]|uniref:Uncharacterized protein n=1 Tax=Heterobasidion irregulare (strain TC 32-1) TaxID=747525 RepID=W4KJ88_HETIT|nr:uncharacterized protein HETIRDRAFT_457549 [Heterobasidion irregulare TC 32-1]ETW85918.1 hypothetical protein HETIRDRAFT_457549 [Heterobasidion irregulare TC 32-1]
MSSTLSTEYSEYLFLERGIQSLDIALWIGMIQSRSREIAAAVIKKAEHYKDADGVAHEFLAVHLDHSSIEDDNGQVVLSIERTAGPFSTAPLWNAITNLSSLATDRITIPFPYVKDPIAFINHSSHVILLSTLEFPSETAPNDLDLSVILDCASRRHPSYDSRFQSY